MGGLCYRVVGHVVHIHVARLSFPCLEVFTTFLKEGLYHTDGGSDTVQDSCCWEADWLLVRRLSSLLSVSFSTQFFPVSFFFRYHRLKGRLDGFGKLLWLQDSP